MALTKIDLKKEHLILLKHLDWKIDEAHNLVTLVEEQAENPFGGINVIEDIGTMIYGRPEGEFDPLSPYGPQYTPEQKMEIEELLRTLPLALEVILFLQTFELGVYGRKWNLKNWKKL
jgi:hypothetical protein